jgi:uncharacterized protein YfaS (alpha-2-macroglobulin family)
MRVTRRNLHPYVVPACLLAFALGLASCSDSSKPLRPDAAFTPYIPAFTSGHIPARSPILVRVADDRTWLDTSAAAIQELFTLDPAVEGAVTRIDAHTFAFQPAARLKQEQTYKVTFQLGRVIEVPPALSVFRFEVTTYRQGIDLKVSDLHPVSPTDLRWQRLQLAIYTSDDATGQDLENCVTAEQGGRRLQLVWEHEPNGTFHLAMVDSVERGDQPGEVLLRWNGDAIDSPDKGELAQPIPALGDLQLLGTETFSEGEQYASLLFSDPLDPEQELDGLAGIAGVESVRLAVEGNKLRIYPGERLSGERQGFVASGLRNVMKRTLGKDIMVDLMFEEVKPNVRITSTGTILPSTDGSYLPFQAVNLNAVDVRVVRIYTDNVAQFLQVNDLAGERELARVGRLILKKRVPLTGKDKAKTNEWNTYFLSLDELIRTEPGAIYRISLGFRKAYSTYPCGEATTSPITAVEPEEELADEAQWDNPYQDYWYANEGYYDGEEYDYQERDEPCSASYFRNKGTVVSRNILASDIGLIAKGANDGSLVVAASDLRTAAPLSGVQVDVLDLQRRPLGSAVTDGQGLITLPRTDHKPFLLVASKGRQRGYLKLDDGSALNVSAFDVQGERVDKGLKGMLYGERGVWRPGDSLYLTFLLEDAAQKLPKDHPVVLELSDPLGRMDQRLVRTSGVNGMYAFRCATSPDAPTGVWNALVRVGGTTFQRSIRIETVKPNRLKIQLDLGNEKFTASATERPVKLHSTWLHGAPARSLKARTTATLTRGTAQFKGYEKYAFNDLRTDLSTNEITVFDGTLDTEGNASFPLNLELNDRAPAAVNANIITRVFEAGGEASTDRSDITYYPFSAYAGLQTPEANNAWSTYVTDTTYRIEAVAVDANGKALPQHSLKAQVVKVGQNWWWDGDMDGPASYMNAPSSTMIGEQELRTDAQGRTSFTFRVNRPNWGSYVVRLSDPASGHVSAAQLYVDWPGYEGRSRRQGEKGAAVLTFNADQERYTVGSNCTLTIPGSGEGRAFISLETGSRILQTTWVELNGKETRFTFPVTADMAPNVYAHVTVVQPHAKALNDRPIRLYGVIPIPVEDPHTHIAPVIAAPKEIRTDERFTVSVSEKSGREMTYTLAIVDEGLLDLTRFRTPDPWAHFYAREALGVRTWDLYDQVIGSFGRPLQRVLALGGSDQVSPDAAARANRFKPVVRFVGPFKLKSGARAEHAFTISNYVGSVRVMVVATDGERAYGNAEKAVPVKKPLMLLATLPRVLGPGETVDLPVTVFAMDAKVKNVRLKLEANDLFTAEEGSERTLNFAGTGDQVATFRLRMAERIGVGKVRVTAEGAGERATTSIELDVRMPNLPQTDHNEAVVEPGQRWEDAPGPVGITGTNKAYLEVSTIPAVDLGRRLQYLIDYPHGCIEQTTSAAFPQLFLASVVDVDARTAQEMRRNVEAGLRRLKQFQRPNGGFAYWPGGSDVSDWGSAYAGHFLVEAERAGFALPPGLKDRWLAYMRVAVRDHAFVEGSGWSEEDRQLTQAYRLYVLALGGTADLGAMNRLRTTPRLALQAKWMLAAGYALTNRKDVARDIITGLATTVSPYSAMAYTYGSDLRDEAIIAEALTRLDDRTGAAIVIKRIAERLGTEDWYSTQTTAWGLLAVSRLAMDPTARGMQFSLEIDGRTEERASSKGVVRIDLPVPDGRRKVALRNSGKGILYARTVRTGVPMPGEERPANNGLAVDVRFQRMDGTRLDPQELEQGTDFQAVVTIQHPGIRGAYQELALSQIFPSGWEIRNSRLEGTTSAQQNSWSEYQDIRDDRVLTYFDLSAGQQSTYRVLLNAAYVGRYYLPPTVCEAMYDHTVNARSPGQWVRVVKPGEPRAAR